MTRLVRQFMVSLSLCSLALSGEARANTLVHKPLEQQFQQADVVIVATFGQRKGCLLKKEVLPCVELIPESYLKTLESDATPDTIYLILEYGIPESSLISFQLEGRSVIFANRISDELLVPVNGQYSVLGLNYFKIIDKSKE